MGNTSAKTTFLNALRLIFRNKAGEKLLLPFTKGKTLDSFAARIPANYYQYKPGSFRTVNRNRFTFTLDLSEYMQWLIYFGIHADARDRLYALVKPGMSILDIGANIGETTLEFSRLAGMSGNVFSFEPFPATYEKLYQHVNVNKCENVTLVNCALGQKVMNAVMQSVPNNSGGNSITENGIGLNIQVKTLDNWINENKGVTPSLLKIDVEGFEMSVLKGGRETLNKFKPVIFCEVNDAFLKKNGSSAEDLAAFLIDLGYDLTDADTGDRIQSGKLPDKHFDIIATA